MINQNHELSSLSIRELATYALQKDLVHQITFSADKIEIVLGGCSLTLSPDAAARFIRAAIRAELKNSILLSDA